MSESKKDRQLLTALMTAIYDGNASTVKLLLDKGAPVNTIDKTRTGLTPLMLASILGHANIAMMLLDKGAQVDISAANTNLATLLNLINITDNHDWQEPITEFTALMLASQHGKPEVVKLLLDRNAQVDFVNSIGWTALIYASKGGWTDVVQLLLDAGANVNIQSQHEKGAIVTPLVAACSFGHTEVVKLLLNKGAEANFRPVNGMTVLMLACERKHMEVVKLLLDAGAEVNLDSNDGRTALMEASQTGEIDTVKLLLRKGAQIDLQNINGITALMIACRQGHKDTVKELIDHGADIYRESKEGLSALIFAASREDIVSLLLESGNDGEAETEAVSKSEGSDCVAEDNDLKIKLKEHSMTERYHDNYDIVSEEDVVLDDNHFPSIYSQLKKCSAKWKEIGTYLGFSQGELDNIGATPNAEDVHSYLRTMLSKWFEWAPGDHRGSKQVATLGALKEAVRRAEYGRTANSLRLSVTKEQT